MKNGYKAAILGEESAVQQRGCILKHSSHKNKNSVIIY